MEKKIIGIGPIKEIPVDFLSTATGYNNLDKNIDQLKEYIKFSKPKLKTTTRVVEKSITEEIQKEINNIHKKYEIIIKRED